MRDGAIGEETPPWQVVTLKHKEKRRQLRLDSGMVVVIFIILVLLTLLAFMLSSVNNPWCHLLFPNGTVMLGPAINHLSLG